MKGYEGPTGCGDDNSGGAARCFDRVCTPVGLVLSSSAASSASTNTLSSKSHSSRPTRMVLLVVQMAHHVIARAQHTRTCRYTCTCAAIGTGKPFLVLATTRSITSLVPYSNSCIRLMIGKLALRALHACRHACVKSCLRRFSPLALRKRGPLTGLSAGPFGAYVPRYR